MANITQDMLFRLSLIKYAKTFGVTKAAHQVPHQSSVYLPLVKTL